VMIFFVQKERSNTISSLLLSSLNASDESLLQKDKRRKMLK
jgi:hypothetical protein